MLSDWYQKSVNALTLAGKGPRTVEAYALINTVMEGL